MRPTVSVYHNIRPLAMATGYNEGDEVALVWRQEYLGTGLGDGPFNLPNLDSIFELHNRDGRPNADRIRSLSVGDVIQYADGQDTQFYSVDFAGFTRLSVPPRTVFSTHA
jgi:hypothetical protein